MSDDERINLRDLPPVEPVEWPDRASQTLLAFNDVCARAAYLYVRHGGGTPAHPLDRGTALHAIFEKALWLMVDRDEPKVEWDVMDELMDGVLRDRPDLVVPWGGVEALRQMCFHFSAGLPFDPSKITGIEQKLALEVEGVWVTGKVDVATVDGFEGGVWDWKSSWAVPSQATFDESFQTRLYALLLHKGSPAKTGKDGSLEVVGDPVGPHLEHVRVSEVYPRFLDKAGERMVERYGFLSALELAKFEEDVARKIALLGERVSTWKFPAVPGSHCSRCPCEPECPLPPVVRRFAGSINTDEQAREAAEWLLLTKRKVAATQREVKAYADLNGPVRQGRDRILEFVPSYTTKTDWPGLEAAIERAVQYGEPFDLGMWRREIPSTRFKDRKLSEEELSGLAVEGEPIDFGEHPFNEADE